ncbi:hypothetical protein KM043_016674 [Ampulex compressa]|nr:hypothetical protein KM043_016674 [Ampulex compressa]
MRDVVRSILHRNLFPLPAPPFLLKVRLYFIGFQDGREDQPDTDGVAQSHKMRAARTGSGLPTGGINRIGAAHPTRKSGLARPLNSGSALLSPSSWFTAPLDNHYGTESANNLDPEAATLTYCAL